MANRTRLTLGVINVLGRHRGVAGRRPSGGRRCGGGGRPAHWKHHGKPARVVIRTRAHAAVPSR